LGYLLGSFFRYAAADDFGTANPIAGKVRWEVIRGVSQSGNYTRGYIMQGFNQDEANRIVHEGAWPIIAGRRIASNTRWGATDGVPEIYQLSGEGPQWWSDFPDTIRNYAWRQGYLLPQDMINLVNQAQASNVCANGASRQSCDPAAP
jgi:hypothetical protein